MLHTFRPFLLAIFVTILCTTYAQAQDGKALFRSKCLQCHGVTQDLTGPALKGMEERVPDKALLYAWIRNSQKVLAKGDPYFKALYEKYNGAPMNNFESLTDAEIDAILTYVRTAAAEEEAVQAKSAAGSNLASTPADEESGGVSGWLLLVIVAVIVVVIVIFTRKKKTNK